MGQLISKRLRIIPLDLQQLKLLSTGNNELEKSLGLKTSKLEVYPEFLQEFSEAIISFSIPQVALHPENFEWFTHWLIIHVEEEIIIGGIGASGLHPGKDATEIGYFIDHRFEGNGFATEAVATFINWLLMESSLKSINAETPAGHIASQKVLQKNGFIKLREDDALVYWSLYRL